MNASPLRSSEHGEKSLSCSSCRQKKIKCDKIQPLCTPCARASRPCVFPARKRYLRHRRGARRDLSTRLNRIETIFSQLEAAGVNGGAALFRGWTPGEDSTPEQASIDGSRNMTERGDVRAANRESATPPSHFLCAEFWSNLCHEVEGIRQTLGQASGGDESDEDCNASPESGTQSHPTSGLSSGLIFSSPNGTGSEDLQHPSQHHMSFLCQIYFANIDPILKILHRPTTSSELGCIAEPTDSRDMTNATEALFFAMYFGAVTSLSPDACLTHLGEDRAVLVERYKHNVERALDKADYLNSIDLKTSQALVLYVAVLRSHDASRRSWALLGLVIRLAKALSLHREKPTDATFAPFEAELRRRLWWSLVILDIRAAEDRGAEASILHGSYDTHLPTNVDDADFGPESSELPVSRTGATDVSFFLAMAMGSGFFSGIRRPPLLGLNPETASPVYRPASWPPSFTTLSEDSILRHARRLESLFVTPFEAPPPSSTPVHSAPNMPRSTSTNPPPTTLKVHPMAGLTAIIVRLIVLKLWLSLQYPFQHPPASAPPPRVPRISRPTMLLTAISILELVALSRRHPSGPRFRWWIDVYVQWHPLAVALAELCVETDGEVVERAWRVLNALLPCIEGNIADAKKGPLWRPVRKLLRKARAARAEALRRASAEVGRESEPEPEQHTEASQVTQSIPTSEREQFGYPARTDNETPFVNGTWAWDSLEGLLNHVDLSTDTGDFAVDWMMENEILYDAGRDEVTGNENVFQ
ncbi:fungal-specific transcription factor domain-containing protein [Ilyonectria sp. MPI-CAGE-AT-0026]|nr:fungal-specific transcription factor domain-containing protein [Ilyonectria sp. MPI-CAGE-AT-0026]